MTKIEYSLRSAIGADAPKVAALVRAAYEHYVERIGMLPRPMTDDYSEVIANHQVTLAQSHATIVGVIVLTVTEEERFLIDNVAVDPSHRWKGLGKALLEYAEAEARRAGFDSYLSVHPREDDGEPGALFEDGVRRVRPTLPGGVLSRLHEEASWMRSPWVPTQTCGWPSRFSGYRGKYVFHCHNLEHEDMMMMANFEVV
jgi:N-acetylglutamate synthase-like GNAT family acetyltransferase